MGELGGDELGVVRGEPGKIGAGMREIRPGMGDVEQQRRRPPGVALQRARQADHEGCLDVPAIPTEKGAGEGLGLGAAPSLEGGQGAAEGGCTGDGVLHTGIFAGGD